MPLTDIQHFHFAHALLPEGWAQNVRFTVQDGVFARVEVDVPGGAGIALPGMANLHSHTFQRAIAGLTERGGGSESFWTWRDVMYRFALQMSPDDVEAVAALAFAEMLESGFTAVAEFHYLHHAPDGSPYDDVAEMAQRVRAAAAQTGIELTLLPVFYAHAGFGAEPPAPAQRRFVNDLDSFARIFAACGDGVAPHSLRAVTPGELSAVVELAGGKPVHIHISEQMAEVEACVAWSGMRPVEWLLAHAPVGPAWCLVHATHADAAERAAMVRAGAVAGLCPITEANLGDGIFPARDFAGAYGIGSDSNVLISVAEELRMLEYAQRLNFRARNVLASPQHNATATAMYVRTLAGGAQALGRVDGFAAGAPANFWTCGGEDPDLALARAVFAGQRAVQDVFVRGQRVVADGVHRQAARLRGKFAAVLGKLRDHG